MKNESVDVLAKLATTKTPQYISLYYRVYTRLVEKKFIQQWSMI